MRSKRLGVPNAAAHRSNFGEGRQGEVQSIFGASSPFGLSQGLLKLDLKRYNAGFLERF